MGGRDGKAQGQLPGCFQSSVGKICPPSCPLATKCGLTGCKRRAFTGGKEAIQEADGDCVQQEPLNRLGTKDGFSFIRYEYCDILYTLFYFFDLKCTNSHMTKSVAVMLLFLHPLAY